MGLAPVVFDAYGTLFDPASLAEPLEARFPGHGAALAAAWRATQLRHTWLLSLMGTYRDFDSLTRNALEQVFAEAGRAADGALIDDLGARWRTLPPYPDVAPALAALGPERPLAILTNGRRDTVEATVRMAGLAARIPDVLSVEAVGVYKPAPMVYGLAERHFDRPLSAIWFVSGNGWDCAGAVAAGLRVIRLRRDGSGPERIAEPLVATIDDLMELASVIRAD
jgi:2-haloacid dehalogenase